jgi:hypothetical protein
MITRQEKWRSHDWKIKTLESNVSGGGSRLQFKCRQCDRMFHQHTINFRTWAVDAQGRSLSDDISFRWVSEICGKNPGKADDDDRMKLKNPATLPN